MFDDIAKNYDTANRILSLGVDTRWRKEACNLAINYVDSTTPNILDVACGTGDMMLNWLKYINNADSIIGIDPSTNMLQIARQKLSNVTKSANRNIKSSIEFIVGEAKNLHNITDNSMDIVSIAYGLRNVVELDLALSEFARVLNNGGVLVILEFTKKINQNIIDKLALLYTTKILPLLGGMIAKNYAAYEYLPDSIEHFITLEELENKLLSRNFAIKIKKRYIANLCSLIIAKKCKI